MIRVALVEDESTEREALKACLRGFSADSGTDFSVTEFSSGEAFLGNYENNFDLVFMDIEMGGMDGMETARALRRMDPSVILVFVTNMAQYAISGYEVEAADFILKPVNKYSFYIKLKRLVNRVPSRAEDYITIHTEGEAQRVAVNDIRYLDVNGHYVIWHTSKGDYSEYMTLKDAAARISRKYFVYANRSALVNLHHVTSVSRNDVALGDDRVDISRPQRKNFLTAMSEMMGGKV